MAKASSADVDWDDASNSDKLKRRRPGCANVGPLLTSLRATVRPSVSVSAGCGFTGPPSAFDLTLRLQHRTATSDATFS